MKTQVLILLDVKDDGVAFEFLSKLNLVVTNQSKIVDTDRFLDLLSHRDGTNCHREGTIMEYNKIVVQQRGKIIDKWRDNRTVQQITLKLDGDAVRNVVKKEIIRQAKELGIKLPPNFEDEYSCAPYLQLGTPGSGSHEDEYYEYPYISHALLSYYVDFLPEEKQQQLPKKIEEVGKPKNPHYEFTDVNGYCSICDRVFPGEAL